MAPRLILLMSSGSKNREPRYTCLSEATASHSQRTWAEVSSSVPHLLHNRLSDSPIGWRCLLRVLCPVRRPVTALDCVLLKDRSLALAPRQGHEISSLACLWVSTRSRVSQLTYHYRNTNTLPRPCACLISNSAVRTSSWQANCSSASQKIPRYLWDPTVHHRVHNSPHSSWSWIK